TRTLYTADFIDGAVSVLDAAACSATRDDGCRHEAPVVDTNDAETPALDRPQHTVYVTQANNHKLDMFDTTRCSAAHPERCRVHTEPVPGVSGPFWVAPDDATGTLYVDNQDDHTLGMLDLSTCNVSHAGGCAQQFTVHLPTRPFQILVDSGTHAVYVSS